MSVHPTDDHPEGVDQRGYCPRHRAGHPRGEPLPGTVWALVTMVSWAMAILATLLSVAIFGGLRNGLWLLAVVFYAVGIATITRGWRWLT